MLLVFYKRDIKAGTFGITTVLLQTSYFATPSASNIGTIGIPSSDGATISFQIPAASLKYTLKGKWKTKVKHSNRYLVGNQRTQFMLRQDLVAQPPGASIDTLQIYDGEATLSVTF
jgi:hypothetical protein